MQTKTTGNPPARLAAGVAGTLTLAAFGPYLVPGLRTEQAAVYATFVVAALSFRWLRASPPKQGIALVALLGAYLLVAAGGIFRSSFNPTAWEYNSPAAGLDNLLLPICVIVIVWTLVAAGGTTDRIIRAACWVTVWGMVINTGLAAAGASAGAEGTGPDLNAWYSMADVPSMSVSEKAEQMGRYSGLFNQPAEAGIMYSVAMLAAIYLYRHRAVLLVLISLALTLGGVLTVSKVFLLIGVPVALWQLVTTAGGRSRRWVAIAAAALGAWAVISSGVLPEWNGQDFLLRLLPGDNQDAVTLYTANRVGSESTLSVVIDAVFANDPWFGFGAVGLRVPYDNGWVEALVVAGIIGAALYTSILIALAVTWVKARAAIGSARSKLAGGIVIVLIGGSMGLPALTSNRSATVVWLLLAALLLTEQQRTPAATADVPAALAPSR